MPYLIDGNNLMGGRKSRLILLEDLARFANAKKVRVSVVFDGKPEEHFPENSTFQTVKIHYNKFGSNADERIKRFVEGTKERKTLFVVTNDRELANFVRGCAAQILSCQEFQEKMAQVLIPKPDGIVKKPVVKPDEMKDWMRYFGVDEND